MPIVVIPTGEVLGATIDGLDLATATDRDIGPVIQALGRYGVIRFPRQTLSAADLRNFSSRLGKLEINVVGAFQEPGQPEVMILSKTR
jgi:taurine dioxygenase